MNPKKIIIALIFGILLVAWINTELKRRDSQMNSQNKFMFEMQNKLKKYEENSKKEVQKVEIIYDYAVASEDIKKGEIIEVEQVNLKQYKTRQNEAFEDIKKVLGKLAFKDIAKGELIKNAYIGEDTTYKIPNGMRAVDVPMNRIEGFSSFIHQHKRIDVVTASKDSKIILENIMIISINKGKSDRTIESITLEIPAYSSATLIKAINQGKVHFVVRGKDDTRKISPPKKKVSVNIESKTLPNLPAETPMPSVSSEGHTMTLILGTEKKEITYDQ